MSEAASPQQRRGFTRPDGGRWGGICLQTHNMPKEGPAAMWERNKQDRRAAVCNEATQVADTVHLKQMTRMQASRVTNNRAECR